MAAIIFDLLGTLVTEGHVIKNGLYPMLKNKIGYETLRAEYEKFRARKITRSEFWKRVGVADFKVFEKKFLDSFELGPDAAEMLQKLRKKHELILLTNLPSEWEKYLVRRFGLKKYFTHICYLSEIGLVKPDLETYKSMLERTKQKEVFMMDDHIENLENAAKFGMKTIWYKRDEQRSKYVPDLTIKNLRELWKIII